ncbi:MAG: pyridoxamine 5'-phosphate oxidase family protein [Sporomusaceae bacterium]|jgi:uncharacterized pyridoxamine 5'-phosphate oxidase family protein|nr:pyridoxamine 5'-phosphate oxidase family protein [Sporomusaceae bacterium]
MQEVLQFLKDNPIFFLATAEGGQPRVRPFGFVMDFEGKLCFGTSNQKPVFKQMQANPKVELSASTASRWLRLSGSAVFITSPQAKAKAFEVMPMLKQIYPDDSLFEIFTLENAVATFASMTGENRTVKL